MHPSLLPHCSLSSNHASLKKIVWDRQKDSLPEAPPVPSDVAAPSSWGSAARRQPLNNRDHVKGGLSSLTMSGGGTQLITHIIFRSILGTLYNMVAKNTWDRNIKNNSGRSIALSAPYSSLRRPPVHFCIIPFSFPCNTYHYPTRYQTLTRGLYISNQKRSAMPIGSHETILKGMFNIR